MSNHITTKQGNGPPVPNKRHRRAVLFLGVLAAASIGACIALGLILEFDFSLRAVLRAGLEVAPAHYGAFVLVFAGLALASQLIILPSGSALMMLGGAVLGAGTATVIYSLAQVVTAPVVYLMARAGYGRYADRAVPELLQFYLGLGWRDAARVIPEEGIVATIAMRLTPVFPSAVVSLLAAGAGIALRSFMIGTMLACWVRPLFFASIGAAAYRTVTVSDPLEFLDSANLTPLLLVFIAALLLLATRLWLRLRRVK